MSQEKRLANNEALFRAANERLVAWEERQDARDDDELCFCECAELGCDRRIHLSVADYERIRSDPGLFCVARDHDMPDIEHVVEDRGDWVVIRKEDEALEVAIETDPRGGGSPAAPSSS